MAIINILHLAHKVLESVCLRRDVERKTQPLEKVGR